VSLNTQIGVLRGIDLMGRVVDAMALDRDPEFNPLLAAPGDGAATMADAQMARDVTVRALLDAVQVTNLPESLIFEVSVTTSDPLKSMAIANTIAETYISEQVERKIAETSARRGLAAQPGVRVAG
jgi:succinoglycan biosynthesis transport protein ExoP